MSIQAFFGSKQDLTDPRLRPWKQQLDRGSTAVLEIYNPETTFGTTLPEMRLSFEQKGLATLQETVSWDDDLNNGLIRFKIRAANVEQETMRFSLGLRTALRKATREFGDGYFNAVFLDFIRDSDLSTNAMIAKMLKSVHTYKPAKSGASVKDYALCKELISNAITGRAKELVEELQYSQEQAEQILVAAIAKYLDNRFSVSRRQHLGIAFS